jgi:hypothetical protein
MDLSKVGCEDGRWVELAQEHTQRWDLVLPDLKHSGSAAKGRY